MIWIKILFTHLNVMNNLILPHAFQWLLTKSLKQTIKHHIAPWTAQILPQPEVHIQLQHLKILQDLALKLLLQIQAELYLQHRRHTISIVIQPLAPQLGSGALHLITLSLSNIGPQICGLSLASAEQIHGLLTVIMLALFHINVFLTITWNFNTKRIHFQVSQHLKVDISTAIL